MAVGPWQQPPDVDVQLVGDSQLARIIYRSGGEGGFGTITTEISNPGHLSWTDVITPTDATFKVRDNVDYGTGAYYAAQVGRDWDDSTTYYDGSRLDGRLGAGLERVFIWNRASADPPAFTPPDQPAGSVVEWEEPAGHFLQTTAVFQTVIAQARFGGLDANPGGVQLQLRRITALDSVAGGGSLPWWPTAAQVAAGQSVLDLPVLFGSSNQAATGSIVLPINQWACFALASSWESSGAPMPTAPTGNGQRHLYSVSAFGGASLQSQGTVTYRYPRYRFVTPEAVAHGSWRLRQRQSPAGSDSWPLRQRQNGGATGSWPLRQRQRGA